MESSQTLNHNALGVIITNRYLSSAAIKHFRCDKCSPLLFIQLEINDKMLVEMFGFDDDIDLNLLSLERKEIAESELYQSLKSGVCINQMLINKSVNSVLPNASVSRVLGKKIIYHFSC